MINDFKINENKINNLLDEVNEDRNKFFNDVKMSKELEKKKEKKIESLDKISRALLNYKNILIKETIDKDKE
jgi:hypothetical protein